MTETLSDQVYTVSAEAFELAKAAAAAGFTDDQQAQALELARRINDLMPLAEAEADTDETLVRELTEARLEIGYVFNRGAGGTSTRLFQHLRSQAEA
jgi:hypothetical protein